MILIKNIEVYAPKYKGRKDVLLCGGQIELVEDRIEAVPGQCRVIDGTGKVLIPGLIDKHVHITGGGGEGSFHTRTPEMQMSEMITAGITTVVGLLGTDSVTRSTENLLAKTKALNEEGITAYMLTGAYGYPSPTLTGSVYRDIVLIQEVIGVKLALSDHRAPNISNEELIRLASDARVAGMLSGKGGYVELHMGDAKNGLAPVFEALEGTAIPAKIFHPTHLNRNSQLVEESYCLLEMGGCVDYTCGMTGQTAVSDCIMEARKRGLPADHITISSDGHGSWSKYDDAGNLLEIGYSGMDAIYLELKELVQKKGLSLEEALTYVTSNVAKSIEVYPKKGCIRPSADADVVILERTMGIDTVIAKGQIMMENGQLCRAGTYEKL
ncbi:beta-aspartyl-peptidase [Roseburia hominis]